MKKQTKKRFAFVYFDINYFEPPPPPPPQPTPFNNSHSQMQVKEWETESSFFTKIEVA